MYRNRGALLQFELDVNSHGFVAVEHIHPQQEERFLIQTGSLRLRVNGNEKDLGPGQDGGQPVAQLMKCHSISTTDDKQLSVLR
jgi:uncharacterized cupin superfamily protein